jgi:hypothetical protein
LVLSSLVSSRRFLSGWLLMLLVAADGNAAGEPFRQLRAEADATLQAALNTLAQRCDELKLPAQAKQTLQWQIVRRPDQQVIFLPSRQDPLKPAASASQTIRFWHQELTKHRQAHAQQLFALVEPLLAADQPGQAYQLLFEVLHVDPTHDQAAKIVALPKTPARKPRVSSGRARHARLKWAARSYWTIRSTHFEVTTNRSAQAGIELARQLEQLHRVWQQVFFRYWGDATILKARLAGDLQPWPVHKLHRVVLFDDRQQYVDYFSRNQPQISITTGYYDKSGKSSYFFASEPASTATWYHEATHQLFQERGQAIETVGEQQNFWAIEGIALYLESLQVHNGYCTLGGFEANRLQTARYHKYVNQFYVPLEKLLGYGQVELQNHPEIRSLYSQSAGLTHFFMTGNAGRYRKAFIDYLWELYRGSDQEATLSSLTSQTTMALDRQYHDSLMVRDHDLAALAPGRQLQKLVLGHTQVTNNGLLKLGDQTQLSWLDLTNTKVTEEGLAGLGRWVSLRQLSLEGTRITDQLVSQLTQLPALEELDLSGTAITDAGVKQLAKLTKLKVLWLTGTQVTDTCLGDLEKLQALTILKLDQTKVSPAAWQRLQQRLPNLESDP